MAAVKGVALVTGASQGIGRAIAIRLADDGYDVAINDIPRGQENLAILKDEIQAKGRRAWSMIGDVSVEDDVKALIGGTVENLGGLDVMIANAAILITKSIVETTVEEWDKIFSVNARGTFLCYKYAGQQMIKQGRGGRIIGATSTLGHQAQQMSGAYASTKFAIRGLTQATAKELGPYGITVNVYAPGAINTTMLSAPGIPRENIELIREAEGKKTVLGYIGEPEDIASIVSYLASKEAHFITGQSISVNGGRFFL
ncbi:acetoin reductase family protein [Collybia nuda]|uniref:Acetoin reductase family protein n=1 Tax=Collybia nuda TaxID=64659 RepID=A0A9P5XY09_9AGAR|nr:acetoin reductase family protein [Collybia nuda]